jgi:ribosome-associated protein
MSGHTVANDGSDAAPLRVGVVPPIALGQFLKLAGLAGTGGEAKSLVVLGLVEVNGEVDTRRGRKLMPGDVVTVGGAKALVVAAGPSSSPTDGGSPER